MKALRIFYDAVGIIWTSGLEGPGEFPHTAKDEVIEHHADGYIELTDLVEITAFIKSDTNRVANGKLVIGNPRIVAPPTLLRDPLIELDALKVKLKAAGINV